MLLAQDDTGSWWQEARSGLLRHIWGGFIVSHLETLPGQRRRKCVSVDSHSPREKTAFIWSILTHVWKIPASRGKNKMLWGHRGIVYWFIEEMEKVPLWASGMEQFSGQGDWVQVSLAGLLSVSWEGRIWAGGPHKCLGLREGNQEKEAYLSHVIWCQVSVLIF